MIYNDRHPRHDRHLETFDVQLINVTMTILVLIQRNRVELGLSVDDASAIAKTASLSSNASPCTSHGKLCHSLRLIDVMF